MAGRVERRRGDTRTVTRQHRSPRGRDNEGIIPVLARAVREVETAARRGPVPASGRAKFQVAASLVREERARVKAAGSMSDADRSTMLKRLEGLATILATTAAGDPSLFPLLADDAEVCDEARALRREMRGAAGLEPVADEEPSTPGGSSTAAAPASRRVVPQSVISRQLANPFLAPSFEPAQHRTVRPRLLAGWELLGPLLRSFEYGAEGAASCMKLPAPTRRRMPAGLELMRHQAEVVAAVEAGHRTFLLADEPGLGKTAEALVGAQAAGSYPLLVVVPNVVKTNWAREAQLWTPERRATVVHGDGDTMDGFADIVIVNYEILDRHAHWLSTLGFRGMVVDEAHFIKNEKSKRSQLVLRLSKRIRERTPDPLLMALTGTPLINEIEDFLPIWRFLGWIDDKAPGPALTESLERHGLTPADHGFYAAARASVIDMGIVRRRKVDVAADIPARRVADLPVELDDAAGRSIRKAERDLARRLVARYRSALATRSSRAVDGIDSALVRQVAGWEQRECAKATDQENVFTMMRRIGEAKAGLAADYAAQLSVSVGKVVFFAKHVDVMDAAEKTFAERNIGFASVRGGQSRAVRQKNIDAFVNDPGVSVMVCSLMAAGVGLNLQVASNLVLAELSWTNAEQTQAIDRIHRIGQTEPVTAWRVIATRTLDTRIAELIDSKGGLAARALDGSETEVSSVDVQLEALVALLTDALSPTAPRE